MGGSLSFQTSRPLNAPNNPPANSVSSSTGRTPGVGIGPIEQRGQHAAERQVGRHRQVDAAHQDDQHLSQRQHDEDGRIVEDAGEIAWRGEAREGEYHGG